MDTPPPAYVYNTFDAQQLLNLQSNFKVFYQILVDSHSHLNTSYTQQNGLERYFSGFPSHFQNAVFGVPTDLTQLETCIDEQLAYFQTVDVPFVWFVEEGTIDTIKQTLLKKGFQDAGILRGVTGPLKPNFTQDATFNDYSLELVQDDATLDAFNDLVANTFAFPHEGPIRKMYRKSMADASQRPSPQAFHWVARKNGKVVSALTTLIQGDFVSFWNGATLPEFRRNGLSYALRRYALKHALAHGCKTGASYLMSSGMAAGICAKLGFDTKWRFHAFMSPSSKSS